MTLHLTCHSREIRNHAQQLGLAVMLMLQSRPYREMQILCLKVWTEKAILHNQIQFFFNDRGAPVGYVTWAYLSAEVAQKFVEQQDICVLHPSEWNEGDKLWIMDFCSPEGHTTEIIRNLKKIRPFRDADEVAWIREKRSVAGIRQRLYRLRLSP